MFLKAWNIIVKDEKLVTMPNTHPTPDSLLSDGVRDTAVSLPIFGLPNALLASPYLYTARSIALGRTKTELSVECV